jgi:hypothetical protein
MHAHRTVLTALALVVLGAGGATACSLSIGTSGTLKVNSNVDPTLMASTVGTPTPATMTTVLSGGQGVTFDVAAPTVFTAPAGYNYGTSTQQVAYTAAVLGLLTVKDQPYTSSATSFSTGILSLASLTVTVTMNNKVVNTSGFPSGTYATRTVITCHP